MKITLPQVAIPKTVSKLINKRNLLLAGALLLLAILFSLALTNQVRTERAEKAAAVQQARELSELKAKLATAEEKNTTLGSQLTAETGKTQAVCDWVRSTQAQRRQAVPPLCVIKR